MKARRLAFGDLSLEGFSRAGHSTWFRVHPPGLAFDAGGGAEPALAGAREVFLTHGHLDHALGVPYLLSHRAAGDGPVRVFCPAEAAPALREVVEACGRLEAARYDWELVPLAPGDRVRVAPDLQVEAFGVEHVLPSLGYHLIREIDRLEPRFAGLPGEELAALRRAGATLERREESDWLSYCGDTAAATLDANPRLYRTRVLVLECTFLAPQARERSRRYGHLHLADLAERREAFANAAIVLHHLSRRHTWRELEAAVAAQLGPLAERVHVLGPDP